MNPFWLEIVAKQLVRGWRSTLALGLMVFTAVSLLIFLAALAVGTGDTMVRNSVSLFSGHISGRGLAAGVDAPALTVPGVAGVCRRDQYGVRLDGPGASLPLTVLAVDPAAEARHTALGRKLRQGRALTGGAEILLSQELANLLGVGVGQTLQLQPLPAGKAVAVTVCGLYHTGLAELDRSLAFVPLGLLAEVPADRLAAIFLTAGCEVEKLLPLLLQAAPGAVWQAWYEFMPELRQLIALNYVSMNIVLLLVFGIVGIGIACAFVIFILRNLREYGILKAMGLRPGETAGLILAQVGLLTLVTTAAGVVCGALAVELVGRVGIDLGSLTSQNRYFTVSGVIYPRLTAYSLGLPPLLAVVSGLLAGLWPVAIVVRSRAADILRAL